VPSSSSSLEKKLWQCDAFSSPLLFNQLKEQGKELKKTKRQKVREFAKSTVFSKN
jgi:hypothetical protein